MPLLYFDDNFFEVWCLTIIIGLGNGLWWTGNKPLLESSIMLTIYAFPRTYITKSVRAHDWMLEWNDVHLLGQSGHNFAYIMTADLLWHVQICDPDWNYMNPGYFTLAAIDLKP